jgi:hypothetical protein
MLTPEDEASFEQSALVVEKLKKKIAELPPETVEKRKSFLSMASKCVDGKFVIHFGLGLTPLFHVYLCEYSPRTL